MVVKYEGNSFKEIADFHCEYFGEIRSEYVWEWEYGKSNPYPNVLICAYESGKILATTGMMGVYLIISGQKYLSGKNESLLIRNEYRGSGLFRKLYDKALYESRKNGMYCIWGFSRKALGPLKRVGYTVVPDSIKLSVLSRSYESAIKLSKASSFSFFKSIFLKIGLVTATIYSLLVLNIRIKFPCISKSIYNISDTMANKDDVENFYKRLQSKYKKMIYLFLDEEFINWRIDRSPVKFEKKFLYRNNALVGYYFISNRIDFLELADFTFEEINDGKVLFNELISYIKTNKIGFISYTGNIRNELNQVQFKFLRRYGFIRVKGLNDFVLNVDGFKYQGSLNIKNWYITGLWAEGN